MQARSCFAAGSTRSLPGYIGRADLKGFDLVPDKPLNPFFADILYPSARVDVATFFTSDEYLEALLSKVP